MNYSKVNRSGRPWTSGPVTPTSVRRGLKREENMKASFKAWAVLGAVWVGSLTLDEVAGGAVIDPGQAGQYDTLVTLEPGNDGGDLLRNLAAIDLQFDRGGPLDFVVRAVHTPLPAGPVTEYSLIVFLGNGTGVDWTGLRIDLIPPFPVAGLIWIRRPTGRRTHKLHSIVFRPMCTRTRRSSGLDCTS